MPAKAVSVDASADDFQVTAFHGDEGLPYQRVSDDLASVVLAERETILGRDVADDSRLASRDSLGQIQAKSVICTPIQTEKVNHGLIHLYSTDAGNPLDRDDLEFTLAVADQLAVALDNLQEKETLADGLTPRAGRKPDAETATENREQADRREPHHAAVESGNSPHCADRRHRLDSGRKRCRQGVGGTGRSLQQQTPKWSVRLHELCSSE